MSTALVIASSILGDASVSNQLIADAVASLRSQDSELQVVSHDLGLNPIPHLDQDAVAAIRTGAQTNSAQIAALQLSDRLVSELKAADTIIIGAPMYNFGMPSTLKAWFDYVLRAGITFKYSELGPEGLVKGKRALVIESRGGFYTDGPSREMDSQEPHIRNLLGFIGITDVAFIRAEKLAFGNEAREQAIATARQQIEQSIQGITREAA
jgi:FMN-dependent NADH-azoreductase